MDNFKKKFLEEAVDYIQELEESLLELEKNPEDKPLIEKVFRAMHSLKGGGAMFGFSKISELTHHLETIYDLIRNGKAVLTEEILSITLKSIDVLKLLTGTEEENAYQEEFDEYMFIINDFIKKLNDKNDANEKADHDVNSIVKQNLNESKTTHSYYIFFKPNEKIFDNGTNPLYILEDIQALGDCKIFTRTKNIPDFNVIEPLKCYTYWEIILCTTEPESAIHDVFIFVESDSEIEIRTLHNSNLTKNEAFIDSIDTDNNPLKDFGADYLIQTLKNIDNPNHKQSKGSLVSKVKEAGLSSIRVASDKLDLLMNMVSELVTMQARLSLYAEKETTPEIALISENMQKLTRQLRDIAFSIVLIPIETMLTRYNRLVRDLSKELKKEIEFIPKGTETELDKNIIESLSDPLMHILRNSIDHGIEIAEERKKKGKPAKGTIILKAYYSGSNVHIEISDDGAGIDSEKVRKKAIEKGLISSESVLSKKEIYDLVFLPGFSTAEKVTDVSGRGVGMDVVKKKIADIRGEVELNSEFGVGTTITIKLPLTLSIIDGLLVKVTDTFYIIPLNSVEKIHALRHAEFAGKFNKLMVLDGEQVPFFYLRGEFNYTENNADSMEQIVVVRYEDKKVAIVTDLIVGEYQAVLKPLGQHYKKQEMVSGATILGDGTVALVLDTNKMINKFCNEK